MAYKDNDKQRATERDRQRRYRRDRAKGVTRTIQCEGVTENDKAAGDIDVKTLAMVDAGCGDKLTHGLPSNYGQSDCECRACQTNRNLGNKSIINHGPRKPVEQLGRNELNRVALPGDPDYVGGAMFEEIQLIEPGIADLLDYLALREAIEQQIILALRLPSELMRAVGAGQS